MVVNSPDRVVIKLSVVPDKVTKDVMVSAVQF